MSKVDLSPQASAAARSGAMHSGMKKECKGDAALGIGPTDLAACAAVSELDLGASAPEAAVHPLLVACDGDAEAAWRLAGAFGSGLR
jgi:hypothetical protein